MRYHTQYKIICSSSYIHYNNDVPCLHFCHVECKYCFYFLPSDKYTFIRRIKILLSGGRRRRIIRTTISGCCSCLCSGNCNVFSSYFSQKIWYSVRPYQLLTRKKKHILLFLWRAQFWEWNGIYIVRAF